MTASVDSKNTMVSLRVVALVLILFVGGLASGIILFQWIGKNPTGQVVVPQESLELTKQSVWFTDSEAKATIAVVNTGREDVVIKSVAVRGIQCIWDDVYYWRTIAPISELEPSVTEISGASLVMVVDGVNRTFQQASGELGLVSHSTIVLHVRHAGNITQIDIPQRVTIAVLTENILYYKEADVNIPGTTNQAGVFLKKDAVNWLTGPPEKIVVYVRDTGTSDATIDAVYVGTSSTNLVLQTSVTYDPPSKVVSRDGGTITIMFDYNWTAQMTYYFRIAPRIGEPLVFQEQAS